MNTNINQKKYAYIVLFLYCAIIGFKINAAEDKTKELKWEKIKSNSLIKKEKSIKWETITTNKNKKHIDKLKNKMRVIEKKKYTNKNILQLGKSVPTANTLSKGDLILETSHVSTFNGGQSGGIGNQNYSGMVQYGFLENLTISSFYTEADDPLHEKIRNVDIQPENLWSNYGVGLRWSLIRNNNFKLSIDSSIERWRVGSGGCYGYNCTNKSNNIFNSEISKVVNDNLISSLSIPITWIINNNLDLTFAPRLFILPKSQGNKFGSGKFYGNNYGVGIGGNYNINKRIKSFYSTFLPINSTNTFDNEIKFKRTNIHTIGLNYALDSRSSLEGYITNSFGQSPATSILTIPGSQDIIYGGRFIYSPILNKKIRNEVNKKNNNSYNLVGLGRKKIKVGVNENGSYYKAILGLSESFNFEITNETISKHLEKKNRIVDNYIVPGTNSIRGGGTANLLNIDIGDIINSSIRLTYGRAMGKTRPGYLFSELINDWKINDNNIINFSPKIAWTGSKKLISLGTSYRWEITPRYIIIPKYNISINNSDDNYNIILKTKINKNFEIDSYLSNGISQNDIGQLLKSSKPVFGLNISFIH